MDLGPARVLEQRGGRGPRAQDLRGLREGVVRAGVRPRVGVEAGGRILEVRVGRADRREAVAPRRGDPQHAGADRAAQPLLPGARVERAAQLGEVDRDGADALGAVEQHGDLAADRGQPPRAPAGP